MISLKLDTNAVLSLFPEGSEARVELQNAIIKNVVDSIVGKKVDEKISSLINDYVTYKFPSTVELQKIIDKKFEDFVTNKGWGSPTTNYTGIKKLADKVKSGVETECETVIEKIIQNAIDKSTKNLRDDEEALIERVSMRINRISRERIAEQMNKEFPEIINEIIRSRLFPEKQ